MLGYSYEQQHILLREKVVRHASHQADHQKPGYFVNTLIAAPNAPDGGPWISCNAGERMSNCATVHPSIVKSTGCVASTISSA